MRRDGLALHVLANSFDSGFAADAALLDAAVGREMVDGVNAMRVDPNLSRLDLAGDTNGSLDVAAPDRAAQPVDGSIGPRNRIIQVVVGGDRYGGAALLFC